MATNKPVLQKHNWDCGAACLEYVLGEKVKVGSPGFGTSFYTMADTLRTAGKHVISGTGADLKDIRYFTKRGLKVICLVMSEGVSHWCVIFKVQKRTIYVMDPLKGLVSLSYEKFRETWDADDYEHLFIAV
jgi:ABC-type bacteriocin/lantibiotic exporter with double-glycine peptidase domain